MIIHIANVLEPDAAATIAGEIGSLSFADGRRTAGWAARSVKANLQASGADPALGPIRERLTQAILASDLFQLAVRPKRLSPLLISRYETGMEYGTHVDDALMNGMRSDVSFTLFLSDPDAYGGGALILDTPEGENEIKLPAGSLVAYPSTTLHRVEPVNEGARLVAVGWARSYLRSAEQRETLFDLDTARRALFAREGKSREFDLVSKASANLLRMWADD